MTTSYELPGRLLEASKRGARRLMIKAREIARRKSASQRAAWERRRREMRAFLDDETSGDTETAGSADYDLDQLPDTLR